MRLPAVFTVVADVAMGYLVTHGDLRPPIHVTLLVASSGLLYWSGMVLNDVFDRAADARDRPQRPIPSGRVPFAAARQLGWALWSGGILIGWLANLVAHDWRPGLVATLLALAVVLYDAVLKSTFLAPLAMGLCRLLNVLLGMSLVANSPTAAVPRLWSASEGVIALGVGVYIAGVTWFARHEARTSARWSLSAGTVVMMAGMALLAFSPEWNAARSAAWISGREKWLFLWMLLALVMLRRCVLAIVKPDPRRTQIAVQNALRSLIVLDAAVVLWWAGPFWGCAVAVLLIPMVWLERWFHTT
jgi:4-hydroxybenzoate polyprenyltransferase